MKTKLITATALLILFNNPTHAMTPHADFNEERGLFEDRTDPVFGGNSADKAENEDRASDEFPEIYVTEAKDFILDREDSLDDFRSFSFYPETSGQYVFQTYGHTDTVMEIYHNGDPLVDERESDGDKGIGYNELQNKNLEAGERYVVRVSLESNTNYGSILLNVRAEDHLEKLYNPLKTGYAKKFWLSPSRDLFTSEFSPEYTGWYNIETYSDSEDTVMAIYHPDGSPMIGEEDSDRDNGVNFEELQVEFFEKGKTYTIQVHLQDLDDEGFAWVHAWSSLRNPLDM